MAYKYRQLDNHYTGKDKPSPRSVPAVRKMAKQQAEKKAKKIGNVSPKIVERAYPKLPKESEFGYLKRGLMNSGVKDVINIGKGIGRGLSKIQNKANKKKK